MNRKVIDLTVGAGGITVPWWVELTSGLELVMAVGGLLLISVRLVIAIREWKQK